jgi:hypothetical protein
MVHGTARGTSSVRDSVGGFPNLMCRGTAVGVGPPLLPPPLPGDLVGVLRLAASRGSRRSRRRRRVPVATRFLRPTGVDPSIGRQSRLWSVTEVEGIRAFQAETRHSSGGTGGGDLIPAVARVVAADAVASPWPRSRRGIASSAEAHSLSPANRRRS